jgi:hypothetical protein
MLGPHVPTSLQGSVSHCTSGDTSCGPANHLEFTDTFPGTPAVLLLVDIVSGDTAGLELVVYSSRTHSWRLARACLLE